MWLFCGSRAENTRDQLVPDIDEATEFPDRLPLDDNMLPQVSMIQSHDVQRQEEVDQEVPENPLEWPQYERSC